MATNRRWQQDIKFTYADMTMTICTALKSNIEALLNEGSEELRTALKPWKVKKNVSWN